MKVLKLIDKLLPLFAAVIFMTPSSYIIIMLNDTYFHIVFGYACQIDKKINELALSNNIYSSWTKTFSIMKC